MTGSKEKISIEESIPKAVLIIELSSKNAATEVIGVMTLKSVWP